jgi:hypothetical protein
MRNSGASTLLLAILLSLPTVAWAQDPPDLPITTRERLDRWLHAPATPSPLDALSPGARERFLASLAFGRNGLGGFDASDLSLELDAGQIRAILAMFAAEEYAHLVKPADARSRAVAAARHAGIGELERHYNRFHASLQETTAAGDVARAEAVGRTYAEEFGRYATEALPQLDDSDLQLLLQASLDAGGIADSARIGETALQAWNEYEQRGLAANADVARVFDLLLATRRFDDAKAFALKHPDAGLPDMPEFRESGRVAAPSAWQFIEDGRVLARRSIDLDPLQIIVTAGCHFSVDAAEDISMDPLLGPVFRRHASWLSEAPGREDLESLRDWNRRFPGAQMMPIHARDEWAMFPEWRMPVFHIVKDGKVVESVVGWSRKEPTTRDRLVAALKRTGLLDEDAH